MNNIFSFATGELSQDAFICWFFNWFNCDNDKLKSLISTFCAEKLGIQHLESIDIYRQYSRKVEKCDETIAVKIDVLLIINNNIAVIIEDKTFTSEHSDQINRYVEGIQLIQEADKNGELVINGKAYPVSRIITVYWKTGFFYNYDWCACKKADYVVDSDFLIDFLKNYRSDSEIIDMYVQSLIDLHQWYDEHSQYWDSDKQDGEPGIWDTNLCNHHIAQYTLMREIFPEEEMWNGNSLYYVEHGSSAGRPWTEMWSYCNKPDFGKENEYFEIFWRIDTSTDGSYVSLRLYKRIKGKWDEKYQNFKEFVKSFIESEGSLVWNGIDPGKTDSYKEADIAHFTVDKKVWAEKGEHLKSVIRALNSKIVDYAIKNYGPNGYES